LAQLLIFQATPTFRLAGGLSPGK